MRSNVAGFGNSMTEETVANTKKVKSAHTRAWVTRAVLLSSIVAFLIWSVGIEPNLLNVKEYVVYPPNWPSELDGMRVALIADLHVGSLFIDEKKVRQVVVRTNESRPDLILLLGDYVSTTGKFCPVSPDVFAPWMNSFTSELGTFAILGNHDWWYNGKKMRSHLEREHIKVLENEVSEVRWHNRSLWLVGIADNWTRHPELLGSIAKVPNGEPILLMTHNPDVFPDVPPSVNLTVAGHTHGGQVSIPLLGPLIVPSQFDARYAKGLITENGRDLFVSSGIGTSVLPIRFMVPPEISVLILKSAKSIH
jgi:predicted MPP superfamily phosphohydrolase